MRLADFDYELPEAAIALRPASPRDAARLMLLRPGEPPADRRVHDLPGLLRPGDLIVVNDTAVVPVQLAALRVRGEGAPLPVAITLHRRVDAGRWRAFAKPGRRLAPDDRLVFGDGALGARVEAREGDALLAFDREGADLDAAIGRLGVPPLPPYIAARRAADARDRDDYQTVFAREPGAVAAPTAGLHLTDDLLARLAGAGVGLARVTLHVGAGTFLPVTSEDLDDHRMHAEAGEVGEGAAAAIGAARAAGGRVVAVGTTSLRLLETAAAAGGGVVAPWCGETDVFLRPGHRFAGADALLTNFHLPRSTLLVLVSAFHGRRAVLDAYARALAAGYRFASYGDACLMWPDRAAWDRPT